MIASAPGKVLWAGEYAVLDGAPAVVCAVDRRARARLEARPTRPSPFLEAARAELARRFGARSAEAEAAARVVVDSSRLEQAGRKLGLGSSAAATVAAVALALGREDRALVHELAHRAHGAAQAPRGARGSGADVAASVHGGLLAVARPPGADDATPLATRALPLPAGLTPVHVWTGVPADTPTFVARVRALRESDPRAHAAAIQALGDASRALIDALDAADRAATVDAVRAGAVALAALARTAGAPPLTPPGFPDVDALAAAHRGAAKPTGAGGGDLVLALFVDPADARAFRSSATARGMIVIPASVDPEGVRLAVGAESS